MPQPFCGEMDASVHQGADELFFLNVDGAIKICCNITYNYKTIAKFQWHLKLSKTDKRNTTDFDFFFKKIPGSHDQFTSNRGRALCLSEGRNQIFFSFIQENISYAGRDFLRIKSRQQILQGWRSVCSRAFNGNNCLLQLLSFSVNGNGNAAINITWDHNTG